MKLHETEAAVTIEPSRPADAAVLWLHGLGADGHDFVPIVPELGLPDALAVRFVFPHAPVRAVAINNGMRMRAWYDIAPDFRRQDSAGIDASATMVNGMLDDIVATGIPAERIVLAGFSQGGAITLHVGTRGARKLAGLLALSTYLPLAEELPARGNPARADTPILMCHGSADPVLPLQLGEYSRDLLKDRGYDLTWQEYPMAHQVCMEEIELIGKWLAERLAPAGPRLILPPLRG